MKMRIRIALGATLALAAGPAALGQQRISPVTINPGPANGGVINYGPSPIYGSPYGFGSYPMYGGVGVYGGGVGLVPPGPWGGGLGYGGGYGNDPAWQDPIGRQQQYALANSRYDLQNAEASANYAMANYFQQKAIAEANKNAQADPPPIRERYSVRTARPKGASHAAKAAPTLPLDQLMTPEGKPLWPDAAPANDGRAAFDAALATLAKEFQDAGRADVQDVNVARDALHAYGQPALTKVRRERPAQAATLKTFLNSLDATLTAWAK